MNNNIKNLIKEDFAKFIDLVNLGIIDKEIACEYIIQTNDACCIYTFALNVDEINVSKLEDAIIKTGNAEYIYNFALNVKGANIQRLYQFSLIIRGNKYIKLFNQKFANIINSSDGTNYFEDLMQFLDEEEYKQIKKRRN